MSWRVGLLMPSSNAVMEVDFYRSLPHDATLHVGRLHQAESETAADEEDVDRFVVPAANALAAVFPHVVVFDGGGAMGMQDGAAEQRLGERIAEATGAVAIGVRAATLQALRDAQAARVAIVTPYSSD